jgi:lincosamide nucleotidyltransferase A/C/D/E
MNGRARPKLWYRITGAMNVVVWKLPLPHRVSLRLSALVYRSPPMPADHVADVMALLEDAGVRAFCAGGWGVDVLMGRQTRKHRDLDIVVETADLGAARRALGGIGYSEWYTHDSDTPMHARVVVRDERARVIDMHPVDIAAARVPLASGTVAGRPAPCLSAGVQEGQHLGYRKRVRDRFDLWRLRRVLLGPATALVIPIPDADALLDRASRDHGLPAPVTLVAPFMSGPAIDQSTERELADVLESIPAFSFTLTGDGDAQLTPLARELAKRFPDRPPGTTAAAGPPDAARTVGVPLRVHADEVWLMASDGKRWVCRTRFPLGPRCDDRGSVPGPAA